MNSFQLAPCAAHLVCCNRSCAAVPCRAVTWLQGTISRLNEINADTTNLPGVWAREWCGRISMHLSLTAAIRSTDFQHDRRDRRLGCSSKFNQRFWNSLKASKTCVREPNWKSMLLTTADIKKGRRAVLVDMEGPCSWTKLFSRSFSRKENDSISVLYCWLWFEQVRCWVVGSPKIRMIK